MVLEAYSNLRRFQMIAEVACDGVMLEPGSRVYLCNHGKWTKQTWGAKGGRSAKPNRRRKG